VTAFSMVDYRQRELFDVTSLNYAAYRFYRRRFSPEALKSIFPQASKFELMYQDEQGRA
jgi:hypothetical protein